MVILILSNLWELQHWRQFSLTFLSPQLQNFLVIIGLVSPIHFPKRLHSFTLICLSLKKLLLLSCLQLLLLSLALKQLLFSLEFIFYCLAYQCISRRPFNVLDIQASKILFFPCSRINQIVVDDTFFSYGRIVADSLEMFFISGLEILVALRYLDYKSRSFSVFEGAVGYEALLVKRICSVVGRTVQFYGHINKINKTGHHTKPRKKTGNYLFKII